MSASERRRDHHVRHGRAAAVSRLSDPIENHDGCAKPLVFAAGALFLVGTIGVTMVGNVPLNDELVPHDPQDPSAQEIWRDLVNWTPLEPRSHGGPGAGCSRPDLAARPRPLTARSAYPD